MNEIRLAVREYRAQAEQIVACEVLLDRIEVMADIGAYASEFGIFQPLQISVRLSIIAPVRDELGQTFDYARILAHARTLATQRTTLIETFAYRLAQLCLESPLVIEAEVQVDKPRAVPGCLAGTRIQMRKTMMGN